MEAYCDCIEAVKRPYRGHYQSGPGIGTQVSFTVIINNQKQNRNTSHTLQSRMRLTVAICSNKSTKFNYIKSKQFITISPVSYAHSPANRDRNLPLGTNAPLRPQNGISPGDILQIVRNMSKITTPILRFSRLLQFLNFGPGRSQRLYFYTKMSAMGTFMLEL